LRDSVYHIVEVNKAEIEYLLKLDAMIGIGVSRHYNMILQAGNESLYKQRHRLLSLGSHIASAIGRDVGAKSLGVIYNIGEKAIGIHDIVNICDDFAKDFKGVLMDIKSQSEIRAESGHIELMKIDINLDFERKIEALKEAMTKSVSSKASGIISRSFCQPAISYGINALGDQVERAITKSTETFRDRAVRIHEDQRKEYAIEVVAGDKKDEKLSKAKPDSYDKKVLSGAKDDVLDESKPGDITSLAGISESNKKKIEIYDESGKIIKVVGGSYKGEVYQRNWR
jgi:hypothetical protein